MANIPSNKHPIPTSSSRQPDPDVLQKDKALTSKVSSIAQSILPKSTESTTSEEPLALAVPWPNEQSKLPETQDLELKDPFLETLKAPYPPLDVFQSIITKIEDVDTLLEIWTELITKPEDDSLEDLLVDVFQAIYQKNRDLSWEAYFRTGQKQGQKIKIKKRIVDCLKPSDLEFFFSKIIGTNDRFSMVLLLRKITAGKTKLEIRNFLRPMRFDDPIKRICLPLLNIISGLSTDTIFSRLDFLGLVLLSTREFQNLCFDFFEAGWGTKEEFVTKALCYFWNKITSSDTLKEALEALENGILDIGESHDPNLSSGNIPLVVLLFSVGILYPKVQKEIRAIENSPLEFKPEDFDSDIAGLDSKSKGFFNKIRTLLLPFEEAIKNLEEVDPLDPESFPCIRAKHPQFSGSCTVKNFNSLLSMSSLAPSIIMKGGFVHHSVYAEVFRLGDQYFALVHNLGAGGEIHQRDHGNKIKPLALYFEETEHLIEFSKVFCNNDTTKEEYLSCVKAFALNEERLKKLPDQQSASPFVRSLSFIDSSRTNPMHSVYREFRGLQREIIRKLIDHTGSSSEVKATASAKRKWQKKGKATSDQ